MCWADDNPELFVAMEKTRMYIFRQAAHLPITSPPSTQPPAACCLMSHAPVCWRCLLRCSALPAPTSTYPHATLPCNTGT